MAAKILECSEDDLIHFAAAQKIEIHVLTGEHCIGNDTVDGSDILLPTITPVDYLYFVNLEAGHDYHLYLKVKPSIDSICYVVACSPFFNFCGDEVTLINNFVILHSELMKLKKPVEQNAISDLNNAQEISESERNKLLKQIGVLALMLSKKVNTLKKSSGEPNKLQIAEAVKVLLDGMPDIDQKALVNSSLRESIAEGLRLLNK